MCTLAIDSADILKHSENLGLLLPIGGKIRLRRFQDLIWLRKPRKVTTMKEKVAGSKHKNMMGVSISCISEGPCFHASGGIKTISPTCCCLHGTTFAGLLLLLFSGAGGGGGTGELQVGGS